MKKTRRGSVIVVPILHPGKDTLLPEENYPLKPNSWSVTGPTVKESYYDIIFRERWIRRKERGERDNTLNVVSDFRER